MNYVDVLKDRMEGIADNMKSVIRSGNEVAVEIGKAVIEDAVAARA